MEKRELTEEERAAEKKFEKDHQIKWAIEAGNNYFDGVLYSLKSELEDVERKQKHWNNAIANGKYPDGKPLGNDLKANEIIWTIDSLQQINLHHELGARAVAKLAAAFDIDL